ncbi:LysE family translocator [Staphylococcus gallinarum]|uniref:LysE family translocator n=1 Tax=Staphylococcus gallinarum TaxID=1293 RepID=UPI00211C415A|nr:LysE family translocator [Staphylococcus gallinarum]MCQ9289285.1 LysE family translocator [Staphylococcus gallinarum]
MEQIISFFAITLMIIIVPGPDFFIVINNSIAGTAKNGIIATIGITTAHIVYSTFAALGLIFILASSFYVFTAIKILGALYIAYLGIKTILNAHKNVNIDQQFNMKNNISALKSFRQGFMSTILNPKVILFYVSVLPQFVTQSDGTSKLLILSASVILIIFIWFTICSYIFDYIKTIFKNQKFKSIFDYFVGATLITLACSLFKLQR